MRDQEAENLLLSFKERCKTGRVFFWCRGCRCTVPLMISFCRFLLTCCQGGFLRMVQCCDYDKIMFTSQSRGYGWADSNYCKSARVNFFLNRERNERDRRRLRRVLHYKRCSNSFQQWMLIAAKQLGAYFHLRSAA